MRTLFTVVSLGCALAACGEEDPTPSHDDDDFEGDASFPSGHVDAGISIPGEIHYGDASLQNDAGSRDGGVVIAPSGDAGTASSSAAKFFLPTTEPTNTSAPSLELDAQGNVHMVYPQYVHGNAFYGFCAKGQCNGEDDVKFVEFETDGTVGNAMIALTADGKPRVLLNSFAYLYYGECDAGCTDRSNWQFKLILKHDNDKEVSGEAFTIDNHGQPRFLIHTYRALFGIGMKPAKTELASCDGGCTESANWSYATVADPVIWYGSSLRYDAQGNIHVATNQFDYAAENPAEPVAIYVTCSGDCNGPDNWNGVSFNKPYESMTEAVNMNPAVSLALTKSGQPRVAQINLDQEGTKTVSYYSCDADCTNGTNWIYAWSLKGSNIDAGVDLALDAQGHPRIAFTADYNIALAYCDDSNCTTNSSTWNTKLVEAGGEIPPDQIFLEWNCNVGAWFLHSPSIAIGADGKPVVGYQARDISGGWSNPDPTKPSCVAGTDMTWSRLAVSDSAY